MKRSKIIQNSKDMLSRSFNPAKCKTALKLATSRLKLLRNKKDMQLKQMKREIALLLESGQDQTARIRVEHVVREEKMVVAYDLLGIYCELIVARLPIIESQKTCPIDLKEAIASVVFASPRCGDVPELTDVKKHFTAKYGKDFTSAAIELRPQCAVSRLLVEKLSAVSPDGQAKIKILTTIAQEHNFVWDPLSFDVKGLGHHGALQTNNSTSRKEGAAEFQDHLSNSNVHVLPSQHDSGPFMEAKTYAPSPISAQSFQESNNKSFLDRERWIFDFKDATSAAQAAAESAERASMAARAAAQLSRHDRIMDVSPTQSHKSDVYIPGQEGSETYQYSETTSGKLSEEFENANRSNSEYAGPWNTKLDVSKSSDHKTGKIFNATFTGVSEDKHASPKLRVSTFSDLDIGILPEQSCSNKSLAEVSDTVESLQKHPAETVSCRPDKAEVSYGKRIGKLHGVSSSRSLSSSSDNENMFASSDDFNVVNNSDKDSFIYIGDAGGIHEEASTVSFHEYASVFFDRFDSDGDDNSSDQGPIYDDQDQEIHSPSSPLVQVLPKNMLLNTASFPGSSSMNVVETASPELFTIKKLSNEFAEILMSKDGSQLDDSALVTFDDSDGVASEDNENMDTSYRENVDCEPCEQNEVGHFLGSKFDSEIVESEDENYSVSHGKQTQPCHDEPIENSSHTELIPEQTTSGTEDVDIDYGLVGQSTLNFGRLGAGFRHKSNNGMSFFRNQLGVSSSVEMTNERTVTLLDHKMSQGKPHRQLTFDSDSSEEEYLQKPSKPGRTYLDAGKEVKTKSSLEAPNTNIGSEDGILDVDRQKRSLKIHPHGVISRRTKACPTYGTYSYSQLHLSSEPNYGNDLMERKAIGVHKSKTGQSSEFHDSEDDGPRSDSPIYSSRSSKVILESKESKNIIMSSTAATSTVSAGSGKPSTNPKQKREDTPKIKKTYGESTKKTSHVHPKLPDYDALVQSLQRNRN